MKLQLPLLLIILVMTMTCKSAGVEKRVFFPNPLLVEIPVLQDKDPSTPEFDAVLTARENEMQILKGKKTKVFGYHNELQYILGPVIRVRNGQNVNVTLKNHLEEETTLHWHGLHIQAENDGVFYEYGSKIDPKDERTIQYQIDQQAATLWYHPHTFHKTSRQAYMGLAGLFIIDDENSDTLDIPKIYGYNDIPLVIQDKRFTKENELDYNINTKDRMFGILGDVYLVNGVNTPYLEVPRLKMRFRILNGANARFFNLRFDDNREFYQIASDGGFLEKPVPMRYVVLSPAERAEIIVDFTENKHGDKIHLSSIDLDNQSQDVMEFRVTNGATDRVKGLIGKKVAVKGLTANENDKKMITEKDIYFDKVPDKLNTIHRMTEDEAVITRRFVMETVLKTGEDILKEVNDEHHHENSAFTMQINRKLMDMARIDNYVGKNSIEIWEIFNPASKRMSMPHNWHIHDVQFQVLDIDGKLPPENERGWKDTVAIWQNEIVRLIIKFGKYKGKYVYHCHILEHEDAGMMGNFMVADEGIPQAPEAYAVLNEYL